MRVIACRDLLLFILVFYFASPVQQVTCLEWIVDDAVYITPESENSTDSELETRSPDEADEKRLSGECVKLRECYPILFLTDRKEPDYGYQYQTASINSDLVDFILETVDLCQPKSANNETIKANNIAGSIDSGELYIWCHLRGIRNTTSQPLKPIIIQSKAENDEGACGQTSKVISASKSDPAQVQDDERVVGGTEIKHGDAPYIVVMKFKGKQVCGGSVIDDHHVLTAAHCVSHLKATLLHHLQFFIGDHNIKDPIDTQHQERNVSKIIYHKEFSADTLHDDIAMVKLSEPITYTRKVAPVCLSDGSQPIDDGNTHGRLVGWGQLEEGGERPQTPRTAELRIWKTEDCEEIYDGIVPEDIMEKAFCAGGFQDGGETDACKGDSGGPLTVTRNNRMEQVGIVSFGIGCGRYPGVFTKVSEYTSWIDRHRSRYRT